MYEEVQRERDQQNSLQHQRWTEDKDNGSIYHFK